jgi:hypothetical protein
MAIGNDAWYMLRNKYEEDLRNLIHFYLLHFFISSGVNVTMHTEQNFFKSFTFGTNWKSNSLIFTNVSIES